MNLLPGYVPEKHFRTLWIVSVFSVFLVCKPSAMGNNPYANLFTEHEVTKAERYSETGTWETRISALDSAERDFIRELNKIDGFEDSPEPETDPEPWKDRLRTVRSRLPESVNSILDRSLLKVILCRNLGGTGVTGFVYDKNGPVGGIVFLDSGMLNRNANDWITRKENSAFRSRGIELSVEIEKKTENDVEAALEYILLHELGHIISVQRKIVPDFRNRNRDFSGFEFSSGIWSTETASFFDPEFPQRKRIKFYAEQPLDLASDWESIYPILFSTPFPTLYSAMNGDDFFAESFVSYVHTILQKKIWRLTIRQNGKKTFVMENGISERRCKKQKEFLDRLFTP
ncbi:hypothetical protein CH379_017705 [Leptospira ellisii]|uniref:Uncharacterized protein n=1 Tax=Leptospira ellisii TaxID=2023197 RepID=A0A2N0BLD2_9LEPT|nr:hypothetical protein [Leptospira ellisii]MDV6237473.1 hypothetical protein [Leptospira ellisii]PJZ94476.1 hypothetical protein CH379_02525 [Leptospira ellisii]PKA04813.1 hypothetical protein CH375_08775 [Leptospira ellisii]